MKNPAAEIARDIYNSWSLELPPRDESDVIDALVDAYMMGAMDGAHDSELVKLAMEMYSK